MLAAFPFHLKTGRAGEFTRLLDQHVIPVLWKQKGFQDEISLVAPAAAEAIGISVWDLKENAETYARGAYADVLKVLEPMVRGHASGANVRGDQLDVPQDPRSRDRVNPTRLRVGVSFRCDGRRSPTDRRYQQRRIIMTIVRWNPLHDMATNQERMSRILEGFYGRPQEDLTRGAWVPAVDIYSNGQHELVLKAELPDMKEEEIDLTVEDNTLTLRGERKLDPEVAEEQFHRIERSYGSFARTFALPPTVDAGKVSAQYKAGVLTVRLPLREEAKPNRSRSRSRRRSPR